MNSYLEVRLLPDTALPPVDPPAEAPPSSKPGDLLLAPLSPRCLLAVVMMLVLVADLLEAMEDVGDSNSLSSF